MNETEQSLKKIKNINKLLIVIIILLIILSIILILKYNQVCNWFNLLTDDLNLATELITNYSGKEITILDKLECIW